MWRVYGLLAAVTLISGLTPIAARMATRELPPLTLAAVRFGLAGSLLAVTLRFLKQPWPAVRPHRWTFLALGAVCVPVNQLCYLVGIKLANASHAGIAYALVPVIVFWISVAMGRASLTMRLVFASTLASVGAAVVVLTTHSVATVPGANSRFLIGDGLLLGAALSWSLFAILSQPLVRQFGAVPTLATVFLIGTALQLPLVLLDALFFDLGKFDFSSVTWQGAAGFAYITLLTAYTNYLLWYLVVARYDVTRSTVVTNSNFLVTVLTEAAFMDQRLSWWVALGSAVLFAGIALSTPSKSGNSSKHT